jgi:methionyl-tRNA formyltransferase
VSRVRAAFLGTPEAAVPTLERLIEVCEVTAVITRPDRPRGRSGRPQPSPIKEAAERLGLAVLQPAGSSELTATLTGLHPLGVAVVTAFGSLIRPEALAIPRRGFLNVHFSLLPRWRGAGPVAAAIAAGDEETGVTVIRLDAGLDTGPIIAARSVVIGRDENAGQLTSRLALLGAGLLRDVIGPWVQDEIEGFPQPAAGATSAPRIGPDDLPLDLNRPATELVLKIRALAPRPGASVDIDGQRYRVLAARVAQAVLPRGHITLDGERVLIGTGASALEIITIHPPGRTLMPALHWWRGLRRLPDEVR